MGNKMKKMKKYLSLLLTFVMILTLWTPVTATAASTGSDSSNVTELEVGESKKLQKSGFSWSTTWESSDETVVEVSSNGTVTGISPGEATVTASSRSFGWIFTRKEKVQEFDIIVVEGEEAETIEIGIGENVDLDAPSRGTTTWTSSNKDVATVSDSGTVTGVSAGETTVTAKTRTGGFHFWFISWGGTTTTTEYHIVVVDNGETPDPDPEPTPDPDPEPGVTEYTVTFESNGGSEVEAQVVAEGDLAAEPENPTREGYSFVGWYTEEEMIYDFETPVTSDITLYAGWDEMEITEEDMNIDSDDDELSDGMEEFLGTDKTKEDTDDDGLPDYQEVLIGTDPLLTDTDGNGVNDGEEDSDSDGLTNLYELEIGTDPAEDDSDHDGLNDSDEINVHETDPLNPDTDGDGAMDGWEVVNGYNPLTTDNTFTTKEEVSSDDISVSVEIDLSGTQIETLSVEETEHKMLLDETLPGYIGAAFDFSVEGTFDQAIISFTFDEALIPDETFVPTIYYFNEETQCLEELPTEINGNVASTTVTHFSTYVLLNKIEFDKVWENDIKAPGTENQTAKNLSIAFVIDVSGSMSGSNISTVKGVMDSFINSMGEEDRAAIVKFASSASVVQELTNDKDALTTAVSSLSASGGTTIQLGVSLGIDQLVQDTAENSYDTLILLTDGEDSGFNNYWEQHASTCSDNNIIAYSIGIGSSVSSEHLTNFAVATGGKYYHATVASELEDYFAEIKGETIDYTTDSNNDKISDYYTRLLCDGELKLATGKSNPFYTANISYDDIQNDLNGDFDNDGLLNGEELVVKFDESTGRVYVWFMSDPTSTDSDYDGIDDSKEESASAAHNNSFEADVSYITGDNSYDFEAKFVVDYSLFFEDNTVFNQDLAVLASLYALDMYEEKTIGGKEGYGYLTMTSGASGTTKDYNGTAFGEIFGLNDCVNIDETELASTYALLDSSGNPVDQDDVSEVFFGHRLVSYKGEKRDVIFLIVRGTNGTQSEWSSNFDIGADTDDYYNKTDEHPDWIDKENHKGFDVAATRILRAFNQYISDLESSGKMDPDIEKSIFITGHSRGGAIANILGNHFENQTDFHSFVYTMASPTTTTKSDAKESCQTIFNIRNSDDLVTYLPLNAWKFDRYGKTLEISIKEKYEDTNPFNNRSGTFEDLFSNKDYNSNGQLDGAINAFSNMTDSRESYYILDYNSGDGQVMDGLLRFGDSEQEFNKLLTAGKLTEIPHNYGIVNRNNLVVGYTLDVTYSPAYASQLIANLASADEIKERTGYGLADWIGIDLKGKYKKARMMFITASGKAILGGMECPHMPGSYYLISTNTSFDSYQSSN